MSLARYVLPEGTTITCADQLPANAAVISSADQQTLYGPTTAMYHLPPELLLVDTPTALMEQVATNPAIPTQAFLSPNIPLELLAVPTLIALELVSVVD